MLKIGSFYKLLLIWIASVAILLLVVDHYDSRGELDLSSTSYQHEYPTIEIGYKYILLWLPHGRTIQSAELDRYFDGYEKACGESKCVFTTNPKTYSDVAQFDAIIFFGDQLETMTIYPDSRKESQIYIFACFYEPQMCKTCNKRFEGFFNFTWTFRLNADKTWYNIVVKDLFENKKIGPEKHINWGEPFEQDDGTMLSAMESKSRSALFIDYTCNEKSPRSIMAYDIKEELDKLNVSMDLMSLCHYYSCQDNEDCENSLREDYYFYFAFEEVAYDDHVSDELLGALQNFAVPVVFGGADYTAFMPPSAYMNAGNQTPSETAHKIQWAMQNPKQYTKFLNWRSRYSYHSRYEEHSYNNPCSLCETLQKWFNSKECKVYDNFVDDWNKVEFCNSKHQHDKVFSYRVLVLLLLPIVFSVATFIYIWEWKVISDKVIIKDYRD